MEDDRKVILHVYDVTNSANVRTNSVIVNLNKIMRGGIGLGGIFHGAVEVSLFSVIIVLFRELRCLLCLTLLRIKIFLKFRTSQDLDKESESRVLSVNFAYLGRDCAWIFLARTW